MDTHKLFTLVIITDLLVIFLPALLASSPTVNSIGLTGTQQTYTNTLTDDKGLTSSQLYAVQDPNSQDTASGGANQGLGVGKIVNMLLNGWKNLATIVFDSSEPFYIILSFIIALYLAILHFYLWLEWDAIIRRKKAS